MFFMARILARGIKLVAHGTPHKAMVCFAPRLRGEGHLQRRNTIRRRLTAAGRRAARGRDVDNLASG